MAPRKKTPKNTTATKNSAPSKPRKPSEPVKSARQAKPAIERKISAPLKGRKAVFTGKVFVLTGDFPNPHTTMEGWITHHGGRVDREITDQTTHLVCTMDNFKNKVSDVVYALRRGNTRCKIVDWEYIEDSVLPRPRHISESTYQLEKILAGKNRKIAPMVRQKKNAGKDIEGSKEVIEPPCHHVYVDKTGFKYKVVLHRTIQPPNGKELEERLTIYLFESDPLPPTYRLATYCLAKKYKKTDVVAVLHHDEGAGREFHRAYAEFKSIFEEKTGIDWDRRLEKMKQENGSYMYMPPSGGKPVGLLPFRPGGWERPEQDVEKISDGAAVTSDGTGDCRMTDPDLMDDTDSGDDAN